MRTRNDRRHNDWHKALRKQSIVRNVYHLSNWYDNLHQYSKNKIHCSCPLCRGKTKNKQVAGPAEVWPMHDIKCFEDMNQQLQDLNNNEEL